MRTGTGITRGRWVQELMTLAARLALGPLFQKLFPAGDDFFGNPFLVQIRHCLTFPLRKL
jgi:hypothetical protein